MEQRLALKEAVLGCTRCELNERCVAPVPFHSPPDNPKIVVVGAAPTDEADQTGEVFTGAEKTMIEGHLVAAGFDPATFGWVNAVCCAPGDGLQPEHVAACHDNLVDQIRLLAPQWVLVLGRVALQSLRPELEISWGRGRPFTVDAFNDETIFFATFHPGHALRTGRGEEMMQMDIGRFKMMVDTVDPVRFIPDTCARCDEWTVWFDRMVGWGRCDRPECGLPDDARNWLRRVELKEARRSENGTTVEKPVAAPGNTAGRSPDAVVSGVSNERLKTLDALKTSGSAGVTSSDLARFLRFTEGKTEALLADLERQEWACTSETLLGRVWQLAPRGARTLDASR